MTGSSYGVIFDLDGVLTDTAEFHYLAWQALADDEGIPFDREANERLRGVSRRDSLLLLLGDREVDEAALEDMMERKNDLYLRSLQDMSPQDTLPGAIPLVLDAKRRGMRVAIGSSSKNAPFVLDKLGIAGLFDAVADGNSVEEAKPAPDLFLRAAELLDLPPASCIVIEDAASGVDAALAAGMIAVGVGPQERVGHAQHRWSSTAEVVLDAVVPLETVEAPGGGRISDGWVVVDGPDLPVALTSTDGGWRADIDVPAALPIIWAPEPAPSDDDGAREVPEAWSSRSDLRDGYHRRHAPPTDALESVEDAWFVPLDEPYLLARRQVILAPPGITVHGQVEFEPTAWVGTQIQSVDLVGEDDGGWSSGLTAADRRVTLVATTQLDGARRTGERHGPDVPTAPYRVDLEVGDEGRVVVAWFLAVGGPDPTAAEDAVRAAAATGFEPLLARNAVAWEAVWRSSDTVGPDAVAHALARQERAHAVATTAADGWPVTRGAVAILDRLGPRPS